MPLNDILSLLLSQTQASPGDTFGGLLSAQSFPSLLRFPQIRRQQSNLFGSLLRLLLGFGQSPALSKEPMPSPLNSALVTSPTRPSTIADTLAPGSGGAQFQTLPLGPLLRSPTLDRFTEAREPNPLLSALARKGRV